MLTIQIHTEQGKRLLLGFLVACFLAVLIANVQGAETKPTKPKPSDPTTQSLPYYDPRAAFCSTLEPFGWWYYFYSCQDFEGQGR